MKVFLKLPILQNCDKISHTLLNMDVIGNAPSIVTVSAGNISASIDTKIVSVHSIRDSVSIPDKGGTLLRDSNKVDDKDAAYVRSLPHLVAEEFNIAAPWSEFYSPCAIHDDALIACSNSQVLEPDIANTNNEVEFCALSTMEEDVYSIHNVASPIDVNDSNVVTSDFTLLIVPRERESSTTGSGNYAAKAIPIQSQVVSKCVDIQAITEDVSVIMVVEDAIDSSCIDSSWPIDVAVLHDNIEVLPLGDVAGGLIPKEVRQSKVLVGARGLVCS